MRFLASVLPPFVYVERTLICQIECMSASCAAPSGHSTLAVVAWNWKRSVLTPGDAVFQAA